MFFEDFTGYILAGGKSSRMGTNKAFLEIGQKTFYENAVEILRPVCQNRIKVVLNIDENSFIEKLPPNTRYIFDIYENRGVLAGMHAAFADCSTKFAIILAVDLPLITTDVITKLSENFDQSNQISAIVPKQKNSKLQPLCGIYLTADCLTKTETILDKNLSFSVNHFLESIKIKIMDYEQLQVNSEVFLNVNSPIDYEFLKSSEI